MTDLEKLIENFKERGTHFGYPKCCIDEFIHTFTHRAHAERGRRQLSGTGYVPCKQCNENKNQEELVLEIESNRKHFKSFRKNLAEVYDKHPELIPLNQRKKGA